MASTFLHPLLCLFLLLLRLLPSSADLRQTTSRFRSQLISGAHPPDTSPTTFFEVTKPIPLPKTKPCSYLALQHNFVNTYGKLPVLAHYSPSSHCPSTKKPSKKIVLEWTAACKGTQFDRIFGVWLGGVEILRSCTAEPRANGITWTVKKDVTRYSSLLMANQTLAVYLGNVVDSTYTGVYHVNVTFHYYPAERIHVDSGVDSDAWFDVGADLILPISRNLPLNDGFWFEIEDSKDSEGGGFKIPPNVYRAVLEVYVSFHENDEFWYGNYPNEYIYANKLTGLPGNGPFREVVVRLDGSVVGAIWPFTVIFTGGVNPLLWRPITGIGSFDLPSYDIEITPFLGSILDGKDHKFTFSVTNALNVWYVDANLHLWLDRKSKKTRGKLLEHNSSPLTLSHLSNFTGFDGSFVTNASRSIVSSGWVESSHGVITTKSHQKFRYSNVMSLGNKGNLQILRQVIDSNNSIDTKLSSHVNLSAISLKKFGLHLHSDSIDKGNGTYLSVANVTLDLEEEKTSESASSSSSRLKNVQNGQGSMLVKGNLVVSGLGSTQQKYHFISDESCYFRNVSSSNYTILHDEQRHSCKHGHRWPFPAQ